jgi:adenylosuccinate lyase
MIARYSLPEMAAVWSEERKLAVWKEIEALVAEAWAEQGIAPGEAAIAIRNAPPVDVAAWKDRERETGHDLAAFVDVLAASMPAHGEWVHYGLTSSDIVDTAQGVLLAEAADLLLRRTRVLFETVRRRAGEFAGTVMIGRTHGIWAEPTTFGLKLATWAFEIARIHRRLHTARDTIAVGKLSGAVGTYAHTPPAVEAYVLDRLRMSPEPAASQVVPRDRHAEFVAALALAGASLERFATEIRHLQRSEVGEVREPFGSAQKGSSAMPHKRNPIGSENVTGLARLLRGYAQAALENVALWHERDISHSSVERVIFPDATSVLHFALVRMDRIIDSLVVDPDRMAANLAASNGLVYSQAVLTEMVRNGMNRDEAYRFVQHHALRCWDGAGSLQELLAADPDIPLDPAALAACFDPDRAVAAGSVVFERLAALSLD